VIGAANGKATTEALLRGIMQNVNKPFVFCMNGATGGFLKLTPRTEEILALRILPDPANPEQMIRSRSAMAF
jgi:hypothetical protein